MKAVRPPYAFPAVADLAAQAAAAAGRTPDLPAEVAHAIATAQQAEADPYTMLGVLIEGIAQTVGGIPPERRPGALLAMLTMLRQRIKDHAEGRGAASIRPKREG